MPRHLKNRLEANGYEGSVDDFQDQLVELLNNGYGSYSVDELCLHPQEAIQFCREARRKTGAIGAPDDLILRALMSRRKNPA